MTGLELIILEYLFIFIELFKIIWIWPSFAFPQYSGLWVTAWIYLPNAVTAVLGNHKGTKTHSPFISEINPFIASVIMMPTFV